MKTCSKVLPLKNNERPCLNFQMNRCRGYCRNIVSHDDYREIIDTVVDLLKGNIQPVIDKLNLKMKYYSEKQMFEKAAELRDMLQYINQMTAQRNISTDIETDTDYIGIQKFNDEAIIILFEFRKGILLGKKIYFYKNAEYSENETIVAAFILDYYKITDIPEKIITSEELQDNEIISQYLKKKKNGNILLDSPKTDSDKGVVGLITKNLDIAVAEKYYQSVHSDQSKGLIELSQILNFKNTIRDIVCFDISNLQGTDSVASMSFFRDGLPYKKGYRRFKIRGYDQSNDPGMIHEAVSRYLQNIINENLQMPDLIVIDGGITQLSRAIEAGSNFDFDVSIISIAKKFELIYTDPKNEPIKIPAESPAIKIIQGVRDESHRFGVKYHRLLRKKRLLQTELININGIGEEKAKLLLKQFKSVNEIKNKTADELLTVKGLTKTNVEDIIDYFSNSSILSG